MLICLFTVLEQLPHWKCLFSISSKKSSYKINKYLLLLPKIWLKPREINVLNRSSNHRKWWNLWCSNHGPHGFESTWVPVQGGVIDLQRLLYKSSLSIWVELHFLGPPQCPRGCIYTLCSTQRYFHVQPCPAGPHLGIWAYAPVQAGAGGCSSFPCSLASRHPKPAWPGASAAPKVSPQCWQGPQCLQPLHRQGVEGEELCLWCFPTCGSQSQQVFLCWGFSLLSVHLSKSMTLKIPLCSSQILGWLVKPPTKPAFVVDGVKNHSETLNVNVSAVTMWSWSKR